MRDLLGIDKCQRQTAVLLAPRHRRRWGIQQPVDTGCGAVVNQIAVKGFLLVTLGKKIIDDTGTIPPWGINGAKEVLDRGNHIDL